MFSTYIVSTTGCASACVFRFATCKSRDGEMLGHWSARLRLSRPVLGCRRPAPYPAILSGGKRTLLSLSKVSAVVDGLFCINRQKGRFQSCRGVSGDIVRAMMARTMNVMSISTGILARRLSYSHSAWRVSLRRAWELNLPTMMDWVVVTRLGGIPPTPTFQNAA